MPDIPQEFFETRQAAAVLKHAILRNYLPPWAGKVGSTSVGNRVAIADCYAGAGRYADGSPGSPAIVADIAAQTGLQNRKIEAYFMEQDRATYDHLRTVLEEDATGITWEAWPGRVEDHLDDLFDATAGVPLFLFLDPYGHGLTMDQIVAALAARRNAPATEALIRIDAPGIWRIRGRLTSTAGKGREATLHRLDQTAGGSWWRDENDPSLGTPDYLEWFMGQLLRRVCDRTGYAGWSVDIRRRADQLPTYYMLFLTRHRDGMTVFNESLSLATRAWRRRILELAAEGSLFDDALVESEFEGQEKKLEQEWHNRLRVNVMQLLEEHHNFGVFAQFEEVFAGTLGMAREKHLRKVLKELHSEGLTRSDSKGDLYRKVVVRA